MKTIGIIGGMSWESTQVYYQLINRAVQQRLGGVHSAKILLDSYDFAEMAAYQQRRDWPAARALMEDSARKLVQAGADFLIIACNTMHLLAEEVAKAAQRPVLHIADPLGAAIAHAGLERVGLLGSRFTMDEPGVISGRLKTRFGIDTIVPEAEDHAMVDRVIYEELIRGQFLPASRAAYGAVMARLLAQGAQGIILGCTEIPLLVAPGDVAAPTFDTTALHAQAAVQKALED